ncbi:AMP-binding enzyme [Corynebacterium sp. UMB10119B.1]|uniref:AMP-binding enzyme n=1 Tax=Corynebacterium sp. UMB10119B.1 TaxID=3050601 RepID=UPI00254C537D|nr:hypothetical protein [Corynebacterium sp. UMB10119B]MDK8364567.1 hypothetical protein [Corynebacterium sp. UMB10119B]
MLSLVTPDVLDVAVVGDLHEVYGETVVAVIVPTDPENPPTLESIRVHAAQTLSKFNAALRVLECVVDRRAWFGVAQHVGVLAGTS